MDKKMKFFVVLLVLWNLTLSTAFHHMPSFSHHTKVQLSNQNKENNPLGGDFATRGLFGLTELFGKMTNPFTSNTNALEDDNNMMIKSITRKDLLIIANCIKKEYEKIFWATGNMDTSLWADDCVFSDPFSSFGGNPGSTDRFKANADNLGKFVENPTLKITDFQVERNVTDILPVVATGEVVKFGEILNLKTTQTYNVVKVGWVFSSTLKLPWRPVLAAAGTTTHYLDPTTQLIVRYEERWKSNPWDVIKRIFVPSQK